MAKKTSAARHTHKYILEKRGADGQYVVYACFTCTHFLPAASAQGKPTICWRCGDKTSMPVQRPERYIKRPHCLTCTKKYPHHENGNIEIDVKKLAEMTIDDLLGDD